MKNKNTKEYFWSTTKQLKLDLPLDHNGMLIEAKKLKDRFVVHRLGSYDHKGWKSLVLHGVSEGHSNYWKAYGYESAVAAAEDSRWTPASEECPIIMDFIRNTFPSQRFARVRLMLLEANGYISSHTDSSVPILENINIALNNPKGCIWQWGDGETLFMESGSCYAMNIHYPHSIINNSNEDRYHLLVHRHDSTDEWKDLINKACIEQNVIGNYFEHEILI